MDIKNKIEELKKFLGIELIECDYFTGIQNHNGNFYFNVVLSERVSESDIYTKLIRSVKFNIISKVEPNGANRLAIFF